MALVPAHSRFSWPLSRFMPGAANPPNLTTWQTLDAAGEYASLVLQADQAMTVSHVAFRNGTATGSPTLNVRIETVDTTTGQPTGTLWAPNTSINTGVLASNAFGTYALTAAASIAVGDVFAIKLAYSSGTSVIVQQVTNVQQSSARPYYATSIGGTAAKAIASGLVMALGSSATSFYEVPQLYPFSSVSFSAFNNASSAKKGARFKVPFRCGCVGIRISQGTAVGDFNIILMDDSGAELANSSTAIDANRRLNTGFYPLWLRFDNAVPLSPNTWYRAVIEPSTATNARIDYFILPSSNFQSAWPGGGDFYMTEFAAPTWTDTVTQIPELDIIIDQLDDGNNNSPIWAMAGG